jgi:TRAP-type transport system periplasmic protein
MSDSTSRSRSVSSASGPRRPRATRRDTIAAGGTIKGLDGIESYPAAIRGNNYGATAKYTVADAPIWPRPYVVFADTDAWKRLSPAQRDVLRRASDRSRSGMLEAILDRERDGLAGMCRSGARTVQIGEAGRAKLSRAVAPVLDGLRADPATPRRDR